MFLIEFLIVLGCILIGARIGGIGLGVMGGIGLAILSFGFGMQPTSPPIDVMLMIMAVVAAAASMQAAGGLDYLIKIATHILHRNPRHITFIAPVVTYFFTMMAGTGHVAYSVLPVIAEVSRRSGIRPERPLSMAVIASQFAIVASPIAAAVVALVAFLEPQGITLTDVLMITIPSTILGLACACLFVNKIGVELKDDPEYQRRLQDPEFRAEMEQEVSVADIEITPQAKKSVALFLFGAIIVVVMGALPSLRPQFNGSPMGMAHTIEIVMLSIAALIILLCKPNGNAISQGSVFHAGMRAIVAIFGIAWLGDTFIGGHGAMVKEAVSGLVEVAPWTFAFALFALSVMVNSQGATTAVLVPVAITLGLPPAVIIAVFVAVNGYFFIPNYGPIIASIDFDRTGTTRIGKYIFNHSFMIPGLLSMVFSIGFGLLLTNILM
ncbi:C4-dicarboxylate ABC transporter [Vibrio navarrensis]|jgi:anaerobic C4-dicarboxylate transporter DcuB|uniref:C4-dicarboxylate transporter n=2 Tax=Vibrio TaxID=662 RepID=A0AAI9CW38_9VIBR|nr:MULTISPECIES: anaerobic C4-dicarboxylate transporter [Vibrio]EGR2797666.1 anaerobic C4-dicarboxylate transporter [Vibrio navarrensis]EHA1126769.1 anaerobic C4-dicarboxylate transporter [Vibrio navarrensis]EJL6395971.1 anaerobic C4-dicarboxylate transporter [Vibrio navarrensis]EJL6399794.1 anaerobic C4-dicarboxylate transporter [Vibrio navarrensis]EJL6567400.1 anaerobic C4-dicarboxylate transporter [Vibrio navarrensis]